MTREQLAAAATALCLIAACAIGLSPKAAFGSVAVCGPDRQVASAYFEDFENQAGVWAGWRSIAIGTPVDGLPLGLWSFPPPAPGNVPSSGSLNLWGDTFAVAPGTDAGATLPATDSAIEMRSDLAVPQGAYLTVAHRFSFAGSPGAWHQGGVIEYSLDRGATWLDTAHLADGEGSGRYNGDLTVGPDPTSPNPLAGRRGFVGDSSGYRSTRLNLAPLAGRDARFRFRHATAGTSTPPPSSEFRGWAVDDLHIFTCATRATPPSGGQGDEQFQSRPTSLALRVKNRPPALRRGQKAVLQVVARNLSTFSSANTRVCFRASRRLIAGPRCVRIGLLPARASAVARFPIRVLPRAKPGSRVSFRFALAGRGHLPATTGHRLVVLRTAPGADSPPR